MNTIDVIKSAYRQTKDGFAITFVLHPQDDHDELARAPIGSQWQIRAVPLDDDGNPQQDTGAGTPPVKEAGPQTGAAYDADHKPVAAPVSRLTGQAGMACRNALFRKFLTHHGMLKDDTEYGAAVAVRFICGPDIHHPLDSRCEIIPGTDAGDKWDALWGRFQVWKVAA